MKIITPLLLLMACAAECAAQTVNGQVEKHDYVDLGLPSGTKWATCDVGANKPTETGEFFAWGETKPKEMFSSSNYKWCKNIKKDKWGEPADFTKYVTDKEKGKVDNKNILDSTDDAATTYWGNAWRLPTLTEIKELIKGCDWQPTSDYNGTGTEGMIGTSKTNGNTIFLPGYPPQICNKGFVGFYWSSSLSNNNSGYAYQISINEFGIMWLGAYRSNRGKVRAVVK